MKKVFFIIIGLSLLVLFVFIVSLFIPYESKPPSSTRVILEHHYGTYIAPPCFEQSETTNYLEDATLRKAYELNYNAHDACTEERLESTQEPIIISFLR